MFIFPGVRRLVSRFGAVLMRKSTLICQVVAAVSSYPTFASNPKSCSLLHKLGRPLSETTIRLY